jgi:putative Ca2+/H+ antiporter (TMEM165/GDT1 family)
MNNKGVGAVFCLIAALLMAAKYLAAAIFMSGVSSWSAELFRSALQHVGPLLSIAAVIALVLGIAFLVWGIVQDGNTSKKK